MFAHAPIVPVLLTTVMSTLIRRFLARDYDLEVLFRLSQVLIALVVVLACGYFVFRYTYLLGYSAETKPRESAPQKSVLVNVTKKQRTKRTLNYLDEFLSAIKVFGYLEAPVFHELTKNMTTQKLGADEILYLDENLGFSIVVDGVLQVYTQLPQTAPVERYPGDEILMIGDRRYQLLNEVKLGAALSLLIGTLDLFGSPSFGSPGVDPLGSTAQSPTPWPNELRQATPAPFVTGEGPFDASAPLEPLPGFAGLPEPLFSPAVLPTIVAKAKPLTDGEPTSATVAIIPSLAFQRILSMYPRATSHIVTMVLTRLYKVTMLTIHHYLGLTREIIESEIKLNQQQARVLPPYLYRGIVERLLAGPRPKFVPTRSKRPRQPVLQRTGLKYVVLGLLRSKSLFLGDLLSSVPLLFKPEPEMRPRRALIALVGSHDDGLRLEDIRKDYFALDDDETEERAFQMAVVDCILSLLGISEASVVADNVTSPWLAALLRNSLVSGFDLGLALSLSLPGPYRATAYQTGFLRRHLDVPERKAARRELFGTKDFGEMKKAWAQAIDIKYVAADTVVVAQDLFDTALYYVIDGSLEVEHLPSDAFEESRAPQHMYLVPAGGVAGYISLVVGFRSMVTIRTPKKTGCLVAKVLRESYNKLMDKYYMLQLPVALQLKRLLTTQFLTIDYALEWCHIPAGQNLCTEGDLALGIHIVLSGRFRMLRSLTHAAQLRAQDSLIDEDEERNPDSFEVVGEYGHGELIGEVEVLTKLRRTTSLVGVRDLETARIPRTLFEMLLMIHPRIMVKVSRVVAHKTLTIEDNGSPIGLSNTSPTVLCDYKTISIMPTHLGIPVLEFAQKFVHALRAIGRKVKALDQASTLTRLGRHAFDEKLAELKLLGYFAYLEEEYDTVVYVCDSSLKSHWTQTCISQGDCILLLADADDEQIASGVGDYERLLINFKTTARADLCLLHPEKLVEPGHTSRWLRKRHWITNHHHIHMALPPRPDKRKRTVVGEFAARLGRRNPLETVKLKAISLFAKFNRRVGGADLPLGYDSTAALHKNDFLRLARLLSNEAVGLVLGGGGARGISHVGVVTALERHGIPVDMIGGTLIGLFVGGLYAKDNNIVLIYGRTKQFSKRIAALWRMALDLTYPVTSYTTGYEFNRGIWKIFGNYKIDDFWISYFCNLTNITNLTMDIHLSGFAWRFIRALMLLAGLLPPIAYKGCMLLDGGYLDNLPVIEMKKQGAKYIVAVDVGLVDDRTPQNYGDTLLGFWVLLNRWNPFSRYPDVPSMTDIQLRLAYVASVRALELAKRTPGVIYMRPPIEDFATLDFGKFDEIYHVGLAYAEETLTKWEKQGKLPQIAGTNARKMLHLGKGKLRRRNSI